MDELINEIEKKFASAFLMPHNPGRRILVVDDEKDVQLLFQQRFRKEIQKFDKIMGICLRPWNRGNECENLAIS